MYIYTYVYTHTCIYMIVNENEAINLKRKKGYREGLEEGKGKRNDVL